ncbi:MAG: hypothetical protein M1838_005389 [Thelocarpon superellum]|nr:MAG: hypothetical protein M1838_005389 [Thelocarpon superellum]
MSELPLILVIGSLNIDLITRTSRLPRPGETLTARSFATGCGGKGANQAVACARLSTHGPDPAGSGPGRVSKIARVKMIGMVGEDEFGPSLIDALRRDGVDVTDIQLLGATKTGVACVIVEDDTGENRIMISPNANARVRPEQFHALPAPLPALIVLQLEIPVETVMQILCVARDRGVAVLLSPAPARPLSPEVYPAVTHLILNQSEAATLSGKAEGELNQSGALDDVADQFLAWGVQHVVVTLGAKGAFYASSRTRGLAPVPPADAVDTTGAGDTFVGAYAVQAVTSTPATFDMANAVTFANRAAAKSVERHGAQDAIPWLSEVERE